jgi:cation diffusion facilitator CzcD-associated flavoprotein CzcO
MLTAMMSTLDALKDVDTTALRERYDREREKRMRIDGNDQYLELAGGLSSYEKDRYIESPIQRQALTDEVDAVVVGGGFGGIMAAARLRQAGLGDVRIIEKGSRLGGTWYWNQYPGAQCDIESYVYLPLLEEVGALPSERYARAPEILQYAHEMATHFDVAESALTQTTVTEISWDEADERWLVSTDRNDALRARFVVLCTGPLHRPKLPGVPGIESFAGHSFHTSRWDYAFTGGSSLGSLDGLEDKKVAVIGTGATAIQIVPHLAATAQHLYVFQRTPSSVDRRNNAPTDPQWAQSLEPGWQRERIENFNSHISGRPGAVNLVSDGWTDLMDKVISIYRDEPDVAKDKSLEEVVELANLVKMEEIRRRVDDTVTDTTVAESLKPYYGIFCKRPTFNDEYLASFNRDNVTLVDTDGRGVDEITPKGLLVNGVHYDVDCIIYATGFEVGTSYERRAGFGVIGREGRSLNDKWDELGMRTLHGMHSHEFPNLFVVSQSQGGWTANYTQLLEEAANHVGFIVKHMLESGHSMIEADSAAEAQWAELIAANAINGTGGIGGTNCTPGYYNNEGRPLDGPPYGAPYGFGSIAFFELMQQWRQSGEFEGVSFR